MIDARRMRGAWLLVVLALVGCGGGSGVPSGGGATGGGSAGGAAAGGTGGDGAAGIAGIVGASGAAGTNGAAGIDGLAGSTGGAGANGAAGMAGTAGGTGGGGHAAGGIGGMNCQPDILIVQDRSGSMNNDENDQSCAGGCANSKWAEASDAITHVVGATDGIVNWGIKFFSDGSVCSASAPPTVGVGPSNGAAVATAMERTLPSGNTPTRDAITYATAYLQSLTDSNPKFLLLATDGLPNCPPGCASLANATATCTMTDNPSEDMAAEAAVTMAAAQGINTFVIGIGALASAENTLNQLAIAGGEGQTGAATSYYPATDEAALEAALTNIVSKTAGCPH